MEHCERWEWMARHAEGAFFSVDSSSPEGDWRMLKLYGADFYSAICGIDRPLGLGDEGLQCPFPLVQGCWPAHALASLIISLGTEPLLNMTMQVIDLTLSRPVGDWIQALHSRWPLFGVMARVVRRLAELKSHTFGAGAGEVAYARHRLGRAFASLWKDVRYQNGVVKPQQFRGFALEVYPELEEVDKLICAPWVGGSNGIIRVFESREVVSDKIRATGQPACALGVDSEFEAVFEEAQKRGEMPRVVEIGPFLCDCMWVHAARTRRWEAFEFNAESAALCDQTIEANRLQDVASVTVGAVGDGSVVRMAMQKKEPSWVSPASTSEGPGAEETVGEEVQTIRLDDALALAPGEKIDLLIMHTNGYEETVLSGAQELLKRGKIRSIVGVLIGDRYWPKVLPEGYTSMDRRSSGGGAIVFSAAVARWTGPDLD